MKTNIRQLSKHPAVIRSAVYLAQGLLASCRWPTPPSLPPGIVICWHQELLLGLYWLRHRGFHALASPHRDGLLVQGIGQALGWQFISGSSNRSPRQAMLKMMRLMQQPEQVICLTPDGPQGPPRIAKAGCVRLAKKNNCPLIPLSFTASRAWHLNSWDRMIIPQPGATITATVATPLWLNPEQSDTEALKHLHQHWDDCITEQG